MRVIQIYWDNLAGDWRSEGACDFPSLVFSEFKAKLRVVSCGAWVLGDLLQSYLVLVAINRRLKDIDASWDIFLYGLRIVASNSRYSLFEIDVDSYGLHEVQRIVLVERQGKTCFRIELRCLRVFLDRFGIVLAGTNVDFRIVVCLHACNCESVRFGHEAVASSLCIKGHTATYH
jgi:hypothetical protein